MLTKTKVVLVLGVILAVLSVQLGEAGYTKIIGPIVGDVTWNGNDISDAYLENGSKYVRNDTGTINSSRIPDYHTQSHTLNGTDHSGSLNYSRVTGVSVNLADNATGTILNASLPSRVVDNETGTNTLNAIYNSVAGRPTMVIVTANFSAGPTAGSAAYVTAFTGATTKVSGEVGIVKSQNMSQYNGQIMFIVPASTNYSVNTTTSGSGTVTLDDWREVLVN